MTDDRVKKEHLPTSGAGVQFRFEAAMEKALQRGRFIKDGVTWDFVSGLDDVAAGIGALVKHDPETAHRLYQTFLRAHIGYCGQALDAVPCFG